MARSQRKYDHEYKVQAVKLAKEIGGAICNPVGILNTIRMSDNCIRVTILVYRNVDKKSVAPPDWEATLFLHSN